MKFLIALLLLSPLGLKAQPLQQKLDSILGTYQQKNQFDGTVLIAKGDRILYQNQFGWANRQFEVPITPATKFPVASISKLFTSILILKLQQESKLHIDSTLAHYIPAILPKNNAKLTLKQLLNHLSGLPNEKIADYQKEFSPQVFMSRIADTLRFVPGSKYSYNNVNYIALACVIEQVTGKKWKTVLEEEIIKPLNLKNTGLVKRDSVIKNLAYGYHNYAFGNEKVKDPLENDDPLFMENYATAGAIFTTPIELLQLQQALRAKKILNTEMLALLYNPENSVGDVENRAYRVSPGGYLGEETIAKQKIQLIERNGNINGYNATYLQLPQSQHTLIIFCNTDAGNLKTISHKVLAALLSH